MANTIQRVMAFLRGSQAREKQKQVMPRPDRNLRDDPLSQENLEAAHRYHEERYRQMPTDDQWRSKAIAERLRLCSPANVPRSLLHHVGSFQPEKEALDRTLWISERRETALGYRGFGPGSHHYTTFKFATDSEPRLAQLPEDTKLVEWADQVGKPCHETWNQILAAACDQLGLEGFCYSNAGALELFIAHPQDLLEVQNTEDLSPGQHVTPSRLGP